MKKILFSFVFSMFAVPVFAVCSITGEACAAPVNFEPQSLQEQMVPNHLQDLQKTDAFQRDFVKPYDSSLIHTRTNSQPQSNDYNSNCQFGICLPGNKVNEGAE